MSRLGVAAIVLVTVIGAALRLPRWGLDAIPDELALFSPEGLVPTLWQPEDAVNPPLLQVLIKALPASLRLEVGRAAAWVASIAAVPLAASLTLRLTGRWTSALAAAVVLAVHPRLVVETTLFRAYAFVLVVALVHLSALLDRLDGRPSRAWGPTLVLLPWLHYLTLPLVLVELGVLAASPSTRPDVRRVAPWCLAWAPFVVWMAAFPGAHRTVASPVEAAAKLLATGLEVHQAPAVVGVAAITLGLGALRVRVLGAGERTLLAASWAVVGLVAAITAVQTPREGVAVLLVAPLLPLVAGGVGWPAALRPAVGPVLAAAFVAWAASLPPAWRDPGVDRRAWAEAAARLPELEALRAGRDLLVPEPGAVGILHDRRTGRHLDPGRGCEGVDGPCSVVDGVRARTVGAAGDDGLLLRPHAAGPTAPVPPGCTPAWTGAHVDALDCRLSDAR